MADRVSEEVENISIPEEFTKVIKEFVNDIQTTFPEYVPFVSKWWKSGEKGEEEKSLSLVFSHCQKKFPPRFFDILYKNEDIFKEESDVDTEFLPKIHFKNLWQCDITENTKETIWKYLQLITFSIVATLEDKGAFGDTAKLFEAINENDFKTKLEETLTQMQGLFDVSGNAGFDGSGNEYMPDAEKLHEHITGMLDGKLGKLAREIAEETAADLDIDFEGSTDMKDVFQKLVKNPTKLMGLVKTVGSKLDEKFKSGDLKESELIEEATNIMNGMKSMPGMGNMDSMLDMLKGMGMGMGGKMNMGAMQSNLNQKMKMAKTKERIRAKAMARATAKAQASAQAPTVQYDAPKMTDEELIQFMNSNTNTKPKPDTKTFKTGDKVERSPRPKKGGKK